MNKSRRLTPNSVSLTDLLGRGPVVLTFYRGGGVPHSNIQLRAYQAILPQIAALGARLVAIWPQLPEQSLATAQTDELTFDVLSDVGNHTARRFGLVYALPEELRAALRSNYVPEKFPYAINRHVNETNC